MDSLVCCFDGPSFTFGVSACFTDHVNCRMLSKSCFFVLVYDSNFRRFAESYAYFFVGFFMFCWFLVLAFWAYSYRRVFFCCLKYRSAFWAKVHFIHLLGGFLTKMIFMVCDFHFINWMFNIRFSASKLSIQWRLPAKSSFINLIAEITYI